jgi:Domain of unknown function (DUF4291)
MTRNDQSLGVAVAAGQPDQHSHNGGPMPPRARGPPPPPPLLRPYELHPIFAAHDAAAVTVYQAYRPEIAKWAVRHQRFGGPHFLNRTTWIKPGFLWMMHRSGWASKPNQERVLAVRIRRDFYDSCLRQAVLSSSDPRTSGGGGDDEDAWRARIQWDPDHDPKGRRIKERRAIQMALRHELLREYATGAIVDISDISDRVHGIKLLLDQGHDISPMLPVERVYIPFSAIPDDPNS